MLFFEYLFSHGILSLKFQDLFFLIQIFYQDVCKYIHYEIDLQDVKPENIQESNFVSQKSILTHNKSHLIRPPQWVQTDLRTFDMSVLGKFSIIMAGEF